MKTIGGETRIYPTPLAPDRTQSRSAPQRWLPRLVWYGVTGICALFFLFPAAWALVSSLKSPAEIVAYPPLPFPASPQWQNYVEIWQTVPLLQFLWNSVQITTLGVIGQTLSAAAVAYGFARFRFPGKNILFLFLLSTLVLPQEVTMIPTFLMFNAVGWLDSLKPLIVPNFFGGGPGGAFAIFLLRQFFMAIPRDLDEAATIDGANSWTIFWRMIVPLAKPALTTVAVLSFLSHWNDFLGPLIYLNTTDKYPLALGLRYFQQVPLSDNPPREHLLMAAAIVMAIPCIALFFAAQRFFVQGITMSGLKR